MDSGTSQYLTFYVGGEEYAISLIRIREILEFSGATRVPGSPPSVLGVINLRGRVVPVIDLSHKFGSPRPSVTSRSCVVLVELEAGGETLVIGLLADAVREVLDLPADAIEPTPAFGTRARIEFLHGVGRHADRFVLILDIDRLLTAEETGQPLTAIA